MLRPEMPEQPPEVRVHNFQEVALGYSESDAMAEAGRCLQCKKPKCVGGCPVGIDIPGFIRLIAEGDFLAAGRELKKYNSLPAICGRVCPQERQCEAECILGKKSEPIAIGRLERFAADFEAKHPFIPEKARDTGRRVAVVGSGPAGLTAAAELARMGHSVTIYEALHQPGGVLVYGIPEFRLPNEIVEREVEYVQKLGVEIEVDAIVGRTIPFQELQREYDAIFLGTGAGLPLFLGIDGENLNGVYSANEFLTRVNLMKAYLFPEYDTPIKRASRVAVIGGGNVAMDAARCARRLGAEDVTIVYRRGEEEMPARREEIIHAREEGVKFRLLTSPTRMLGDEKNHVKEIECVKMELCEPDETGRCRPVALPGSEHTLPVDLVIVAIGTTPNPLLPERTGLKTGPKGTILTNSDGATSLPGVYAGGDAVTGAATVISAMGAGKKAALAINNYLKTL